MKVVGGVVIGILALLCIGATAVATGIVRAPFSAPQTLVQGAPALLPLSTQADGADMTVTLSERFLNKMVAEGMPKGGDVSNAQIDLHQGNRADVTAAVKTGFVTLTPKAAVTFAVQNGRIVIEVQRVDVGGFGVPNSLIEPQIAQLKQTAERELNQKLAELEKTTGLTLQSLSTTENSMTLVFGE